MTGIKNAGRRGSRIPMQALTVKQRVMEGMVRLNPEAEPFQFGKRMYYIGKHGELRRLGK